MTPLTMITGAAILGLGAVRLWLAVNRRQWVVGERNGTKVVVRRRGRWNQLWLVSGSDELLQSKQDRSNPLSAGESYVDGLHLGMLVEPRPKNVVFLGGGAGMAPRQFEAAYPEVSIDIVEKDPFVVAAATHYFGLRITNRISIHVADARKFIAESLPEHYDLVVLDVYDAHGAPPELVTSDFFASIKSCLTPTGSLIVNLLEHASPDEVAILKSLAEAYPKHEIARFRAPPANALVWVAPAIPSKEALISAAKEVPVAAGLVAIASARRLV